jgi:hypothetical protein
VASLRRQLENRRSCCERTADVCLSGRLAMALADRAEALALAVENERRAAERDSARHRCRRREAACCPQRAERAIAHGAEVWWIIPQKKKMLGHGLARARGLYEIAVKCRLVVCYRCNCKSPSARGLPSNWAEELSERNRREAR